jgi:hypothetical protein
LLSVLLSVLVASNIWLVVAVTVAAAVALMQGEVMCSTTGATGTSLYHSRASHPIFQAMRLTCPPLPLLRPASPSHHQDAFGNYVVQYVLELGQEAASRAVMAALEGHYAELSMQKFSSNVVEKVLKLQGIDEERNKVVKEVLSSPLLPRLLQDSYGNYVVQSSLSVSNGELHQALVDAIKPYLSALKGTPHGKRILQKVNGKV